MVTGGHASEQHLSSTEIYVNLAWSYAASLPSPRSYLSAATVINSVLVFGKILSILIYTFFSISIEIFLNQTCNFLPFIQEDMTVILLMRSCSMIQSLTYGLQQGR